MSIIDMARPSGLHRAVDEVHRLRRLLDKAHAGNAELRRRLDEATGARDAANAKASQLRDAQIQAAAVTQQLQAQTAELQELRAFYANATKVGDLTAHPAVAETQPIAVLPLHLSPLASPTRTPGGAS
ncbi:hypothetical protein [Streptomyces sp. NPDC046161]|uniref:hypothetical protein n=1 Tax=Streptomyces sp. NPDC046161 TaxID=3155132 RepID=UPI003407300E